MLVKKYNEITSDAVDSFSKRYNTSYTKIKFQVASYDNKISLSITPCSSDGVMEEFMAFSGTYICFGFLKRKNDKVMEAMDNFIAPYMDGLAEAFAEDEVTSKKIASENNYGYTFTADKVKNKLFILKDNFLSEFSSKIR